MKFKIINKNLIIITGGLILISGFLLLTHNNVLAYDDKTTHPDLVREAVSFYELSTGKKLSEEQKQWTIQGSIDEDKAPRWLNHFYDPVFERGLSTEIPGVNGYLAKNWAQFSSYQTINVGNIINLWTGNGPIISGSEWGDFSYEAAVKNYSQNKEKDAYYALGHVLHLVEDMTVPEHTRNDIHPGGTMVSFYEDWAKSNSSGLTQDLGKRLFNQGRKPVIYSDLASYFNNLADYTNTHFFSPRTIQSEIYAKPKITFEDGTFAYGYDENGELFDLVEINKKSSYQKDYKLKNPQVMQEYWLRLSRQAVINGAGIINLFSNQAEAAKQVELVKQKVEARQVAQKSSFFSSIINLFKNPGENNQPALTINSEAQPVQPKINSVAVRPKTESKPLIVGKPASPAPTPVPSPVPITVPTSTPTPSLNPTPAPTPAPVVVYGGGGSSSTNTTSDSSETASDSTSQSSTVQTFSAGDLVINEIMYDLGGDLGDTDTNREWIEIYNNSSSEIDLTGWKFNDGDDATNHGFNVPPDHDGQGSMVLPAGGYTIIAEHATTFLLTDHPGFTGTVIDTAEMNLKNASSTVTTLKIIASNGTTIDEVTYYNFWGANGDGKTLERKSATGGSSDPANWGVSSVAGGTPGVPNNWLLASDVDSGSATSTPETATSTEPLMTLGTDVSATTTISQNTTWTLAGSPYRLFFDGQRRPTVAAGAILTIEPGAKIIPQGGGYTALEIEGTLNAIASSGAPIIFTSIADADNLASTTPQKGDWLNIAFSSGSQVNFDYVEFRYGGQGLERPVKEMIKIIGATVNINHSTFTNSQSIALRLIDSDAVVENSVFSDNACGISVDSLVNSDGTTDGGCYGAHSIFSQAAATTTPQIKNNQFISNRIIAIEVRNGATPTIDNNIFADNQYPIKIESSYPSITNSRISTTSPNILNGIAISDQTHFSKNYTLKKDLPYILEASGGHSPYVDAGATLTLEPGVVIKPNHTFLALNINGSLIAQGTTENPIVFTSFKDDNDLRGGDTNGDGAASTPQDNDWANIKFLAGSISNFTNTIFNYGGYGFVPPAPVPPILLTDFSAVGLSWDNSEKISSSWTAEKNGSFEKIVFHNFSTPNPKGYPYLVGINSESGNSFVASTTLANLKDITSQIDLSVSLSGNFTNGEKYHAMLQVVPPEGIATDIFDLFGIGKDANQKAAVAFYESAVQPFSNSMLSIDAGATVVIQ